MIFLLKQNGCASLKPYLAKPSLGTKSKVRKKSTHSLDIV